MIKLIGLWAGLGLVGTVIVIVKNSAIPGRTAIRSLLTLPHALVFGPIWLLIALVSRSHKECPFCKSEIPASASVCSECTRSLEESS